MICFNGAFLIAMGLTAMIPTSSVIQTLTRVSRWMAVVMATSVIGTGRGLAETWTTEGTCWFNGVPMGCTVDAFHDDSGYSEAWSATYVINWADGLQQTIDVGSDVRASVLVNGKRTAAEQQPTDHAGHCVIRTVTGNVTIFNSGRARENGEVAPC
jgi:hypothetical protein